MARDMWVSDFRSLKASYLVLTHLTSNNQRVIALVISNRSALHPRPMLEINRPITRFWLAKSSAVQAQHAAKSGTPVQITRRNSVDYDWLKYDINFSNPRISREMMSKFCAETLKKVFLNEKKEFKKDLPALPPRKLFHVYVIISAFWKTHSCKLIPNWTRNLTISYTNSTPFGAVTITDRKSG